MAGLSPDDIALILSAGVVLGIFPVPGSATFLCAAAAIALRLNLPAIQLVNQVSAPLQWALLIPFGRVGARILGVHGPWSIGGAARDAIAGWFCMGLPAGLFLYLILLMTLRRCRHQWFNRLETPG